jgi:hypothetical protein
MQMDVEREILTPGVEHGDDARLGSEVTRVASERQESVGGGSEQRAVHEPGTLECEGIQPVRQGEHDVDVVDRE